MTYTYIILRQSPTCNDKKTKFKLHDGFLPFLGIYQTPLGIPCSPDHIPYTHPHPGCNVCWGENNKVTSFSQWRWLHRPCTWWDVVDGDKDRGWRKMTLHSLQSFPWKHWPDDGQFYICCYQIQRSWLLDMLLKWRPLCYQDYWPATGVSTDDSG